MRYEHGAVVVRASETSPITQNTPMPDVDAPLSSEGKTFMQNIVDGAVGASSGVPAPVQVLALAVSDIGQLMYDRQMTMTRYFVDRPPTKHQYSRGTKPLAQDIAFLALHCQHNLVEGYITCYWGVNTDFLVSDSALE
ncbi:hypothetical protein AC579_1655 [Pseudocercospora musae]|uniref:Uncharacterized protein n=1 Tax=Pseudocercospora musae TaxID=113226 RepID=A0A139IAI2_9PEZI|nr:hypothetical protein AC579_1655 [Pseudocercospora musae]